MKEFLKRIGLVYYLNGFIGSIFIMFSTIFDNPPIVSIVAYIFLGEEVAVLFHSYIDVIIGIIILLFPHRHFFWNIFFSSERN